MFECNCCTRTFRTRQSCDQHMDDTDHWNESFECDRCTREFSSQHAKEQHMTAVGHWNESFECDGCTREFSSQHAKEQHMTAVGHWSRHYQTMGTAITQPLQTSTDTGDNDRNSQTNEDESTLNALELSGTDTLSRYQDKLTSCITNMFNEAVHSDIMILIQGVSLPAHRFVICPQSIYLEEACQQAFSKDKRILNCEGSGAAYWRVFEYLYTGGYCDYLDNIELKDDDNLSKHLRVYALANMFCIEDLKTISLDKFRRETSEGWDSDLFLECIWEIYHSISRYPRTIRPALVDVAVAHAHEIDGKARFEDLIREGGDFVVEYVTRLLM